MENANLALVEQCHSIELEVSLNRTRSVTLSKVSLDIKLDLCMRAYNGYFLYCTL